MPNEYAEKMTTFSTRNQSKRNVFRYVIAGVLILILVSLVLLTNKKATEDYSKITNRKGGKSNQVPEVDSRNRKSPFYSSVIGESEVRINGGPIKGQIRRMDNGQKISSYLGIPYAAVPVDSLRFEKPQDKRSWNDTIETFTQPPTCPQNPYPSTITELKYGSKPPNEDCLYLNIWTPEPKDEPKPVLVYIHSGVFHYGGIGSRSLDPSNLTSIEMVVVVTVQYRLGLFGFATINSNGKQIHKQSVGLQDQVKALQWIRDNIANFGGDPKQITLIGHGAGALSIGFHLMNPNVNTLFQRAILQGLHNIWNLGLYGMNSRAIRYLMEDTGCDNKLVHAQQFSKCFKTFKIQTDILVETQQYLTEVFAIPFEPEFSPQTEELRSQINSDTRMADIGKLFEKWNIFASNVEILIGLNSDDDYQFEQINKNNLKISFEQTEEEEDYEETSDDESGEKDENKSKEEEEKEEKEAKEETTTEGKEEERTEEDGEKDKEEEEEGGEEESREENESTEEPGEKPQVEDDSLTVDDTAKTESSEVTTESGESRRRREADEDVNPINLDLDEVGKLCRLVNMFRIQQQLKQVNSKVYFYRVEPKVLTNPLEEVRIVFGNQANRWLKQFNTQLIDLWGKFAKQGDLSYIDGLTSDLSGDSIPVVNIGQSGASDKTSEIKAVPVKIKQLCMKFGEQM